MKVAAEPNLNSTLFLLLLFLLTPLSSIAQNTKQKYLTATRLDVTEVTSNANSNLGNSPDLGCLSAGPISNLKSNFKNSPINVTEKADQIINLGSRIWDIIEKNKPVVNLSKNVGTALPRGVDCWTDLQGWSRPQAKTFIAVLKNSYGTEVVKFKYKVLYVTGGNLNGRGRYIGFATVQPVETSVVWGYKFNAQAVIATVMNMGTRADPIAGMMLSVTYSSETILQNKTFAQNYFIDGRGHFEVTQ